MELLPFYPVQAQGLGMVELVIFSVPVIVVGVLLLLLWGFVKGILGMD